MREISEEFGEENKQLTDVCRDILLECWRLLEDALRTSQVSEDQLEALRDLKCIPNKQGLLVAPSLMYFENRAGLSARFGEIIVNNVIPQPIGSGHAMMVAGVRLLSSAIEQHLLECKTQVEDDDIRHRVLERRNQLGRVFEDHDAIAALEQLEKIKFSAAISMQVNYTLHAFNKSFESEPEDAAALYDRESNHLIFKRNGGIRWPAIARELAVALYPEEDPGKIASPLKDILSAASSEEANDVLDDLGFAKRDVSYTRPGSAESLEGALGEEASQDTEFASDEPKHQSALSNSCCGSDSPAVSGSSDPSRSMQPSSQQSEQSEEEKKSSTTREVNYGAELAKKFNRPGKTRTANRALDRGKVRNIQHRSERVSERIEQNIIREPPVEERYKRIPRKVWEGKHYEPRQFLVEQYGGRCQICGQTFPKRNGQPYFEGLYLVSRTNARWLDREGNVLCLCANHSAQFQYGSVEEVEDIKKQIQSFAAYTPEDDSKPTLRIQLCGVECSITYTEKHFLDLQELLRTSDQEE